MPRGANPRNAPVGVGAGVRSVTPWTAARGRAGPFECSCTTLRATGRRPAPGEVHAADCSGGGADLLWLAVLVRTFRFLPVAGHHPKPVARVTLRPRGGMPLLIARRDRTSATTRALCDQRKAS